MVSLRAVLPFVTEPTTYSFPLQSSVIPTIRTPLWCSGYSPKPFTPGNTYVLKRSQILLCKTFVKKRAVPCTGIAIKVALI